MLHTFLPGRQHTFKIKGTTFAGHEQLRATLMGPTNCGQADSVHDSTCLTHFLLVGLNFCTDLTKIAFKEF